jgi:hypothetical protein
VVADLSDKNLVPHTPIYRSFREVKNLRQKARVRRAREIAGNPAGIATDFAESVRLFGTGYHRTGPFRHPQRRPPRPEQPAHIASSTDFAWWVHRQGVLPVRDLPELSLTWVDYEASIIRALGDARFDDEQRSKAGRALLPDLLLSAADKPVVGEVKIGADEPFVAIIQLMTYIAHLATPSQYARLVTNYPNAGFPSADPPQIDAYLILHRFGAAKATYSDEFLALATRLSDGLMRQPEVTKHVARIVCLDATLDGNGQLTATTRWLHERPPASR